MCITKDQCVSIIHYVYDIESISECSINDMVNMLNNLTEKQRVVLCSKLLLNKSFGEIADSLNMRPIEIRRMYSGIISKLKSDDVKAIIEGNTKKFLVSYWDGTEPASIIVRTPHDYQPKNDDCLLLKCKIIEKAKPVERRLVYLHDRISSINTTRQIDVEHIQLIAISQL